MMTNQKKHILLFLSLILFISCLNSYNIPHFIYSGKSAEHLACHHTASANFPTAYLIQDDNSNTRNGNISGNFYKNILEQIMANGRYKILNRDTATYAGIIFLSPMIQFGKQETKWIFINTFHPFLFHIIAYIHNQDGEKLPLSFVHS